MSFCLAGDATTGQEDVTQSHPEEHVWLRGPSPTPPPTNPALLLVHAERCLTPPSLDVGLHHKQKPTNQWDFCFYLIFGLFYLFFVFNLNVFYEPACFNDEPKVSFEDECMDPPGASGPMAFWPQDVQQSVKQHGHNQLPQAINVLFNCLSFLVFSFLLNLTFYFLNKKC